MMKRKIIILVCCILISACCYVIGFIWTNTNRITVTDAHYKIQDTVMLNNSFFWSATENPTGYSVKVREATVVSTKDFLESHGLSDSDYPDVDKYGFHRPDYLFDVFVTVNNINSHNGKILFSEWILIDKSIILRINMDWLKIAEPDLSDMAAFTLPTGKSRDFHFIFAADPALIELDSQRLYKRMHERNFSLCVSQMPKRYLIDFA